MAYVTAKITKCNLTAYIVLWVSPFKPKKHFFVWGTSRFRVRDETLCRGPKRTETAAHDISWIFSHLIMFLKTATVGLQQPYSFWRSIVLQNLGLGSIISTTQRSRLLDKHAKQY